MRVWSSGSDTASRSVSTSSGAAIDLQADLMRYTVDVTAAAIDDAQPWISCWSFPSIMTRSRGSVPE